MCFHGTNESDWIEAMREGRENAMKTLQWLATAVLVLAGVVLLVEPMHAQGAAKAAFVPTRFAVTDAGTVGKPDVVLIPGLASSAHVWDAETALLAPNYRLHVVQVAGFAGAPAGGNAGVAVEGAAPMLPGIVEELHWYIAGAQMKPVVVGHSMGGLLAMMLAAKYPADVKKMVIVDTLPYYAVLFKPGATVETVKPMAAGIKAEMVSMSAADYAAGEKTMLAGMANSEAGRKAAYDGSIASDQAVVAEALYEDLLTDMRDEVGKIQTPTLVLYEYDATATMPPAGAYEAMVQAAYKPMPHVTLVRVEGSRHFIMYDQPAKFDADLQGFLR
jgi:pimeloyl-ACP methyl ester carboxylesterase